MEKNEMGVACGTNIGEEVLMTGNATYKTWAWAGG